MLNYRWFAHTIWLFAMAVPVLSADRPVISVAFQITEPHYQNSLGNQRAELEAAVQSVLAGQLNQRIHFLSFSSGGEQSLRLLVRLGRKILGDPPPQGPLWETGFEARLDGLGSQAEPVYWLRFRPAERYLDRLGTPEELKVEIGQKLREADYPALVRQLFSRVPIADSAQFLKEPSLQIIGWIIPYKQSEICLDSGSVVAIQTEIPTSLFTLKRDYKADEFSEFDPPAATELQHLREHVICIADRRQENIEDLNRVEPSAVKVKAIRVVEYRPNDTACSPSISPTDVAAELASGGGR